MSVCILMEYLGEKKSNFVDFSLKKYRIKYLGGFYERVLSSFFSGYVGINSFWVIM